MKGTVMLVAGAVVAAWAALLLPLTPEATPKQARTALAKPGLEAPQAPAAHSAGPAYTSQPATAKARDGALATPSQPAPTAHASVSTVPTSAPPASAPPSRGGDVRVFGANHAGPAGVPLSGAELANMTPEQHAAIRPPRVDPPQPAHTGEQGEGIMSPDYVGLETDYIYEPRDGAWATEKERRIRGLLYDADLAKRMEIVQCHSTVCRVQMRAEGDDPVGELLRVPGLAEELGLTPQSPYSLNSSELIMYARPLRTEDPELPP